MSNVVVHIAQPRPLITIGQQPKIHVGIVHYSGQFLADIQGHIADTDNPHQTTYAQLPDKPIFTYTHTQSSPSTVWNISHPLGRKITAALIVDTGGNDWGCIITNIDNNNCTIDVGNAAFAGTAIIS